MRTWLLRTGYVVASMIVTAGIVMGAWMIFFVNPINWKNYTDYRVIDHVIAWGSNGLIFFLALVLIAATWRGLWKLTNRMANQAPQATARKLAVPER